MTILTAELRIVGSDKTAGAFAGVIAHARELASTLKNLNFGANDAGMKERLSIIKQATAALRVQNSAMLELNRTEAIGNSMLKERIGLISRMHERLKSSVAAAGYLAGPALLRGTKQAVHGGADIQSVKVKLRAAGVPESEINSLGSQAVDLHGLYPNVGIASIMERYKELRSVLLHPQEAPHLLPAVVQAQAAMKALDRTGQLGEGLGFAIKAAEVMGLAQNPEKFRAYLDAFIRAQQVMGRTITPEHQYELAKYLKASGAGLSPRFITTTATSMSQELGGSTTGTGIDQFIKQIVGGFQGAQHAAAKEFVALGLARKEDFETTKTGAIKGMKTGHHVRGANIAQHDPDIWVRDYLKPALVAHGYDDIDKQIGEIRRLFPGGRAADIVSKLITQEQSFANHAKLYEVAQGLNATLNNLKDPFVALDGFTSALNNFASVLSSPMMQTAAGALANMASLIAGWSKTLTDWQKRNPELAEIAGTGAVVGGAAAGGALTYGLLKGLFGGFGLKGSAVALTESAAALNAAAARLGATGVAGAAAGSGTGAAGVAAGAAAGGAFTFANILRGSAVGAAIGVMYGMKRDSETGDGWRSWLRSTFGIPDDHEPAPWMPGGAWDRGHVTGPMNKLEGQADVNVQVKVSAGDGLVAEIERIVSSAVGHLRINGAAPGISSGSTGPAMIEAAPGGAP